MSAQPSTPAPPPRGTTWRQPYLLLIELSWGRFLALVTAVYLLIHLLFAGLYLLDPGGIGGLSEALPLALQAFFLSVETMATIGYGSLHPESLWVHVVTTIEALSGLILVALIAGLAFSRFARTPHSVAFAPRAVIESVDGRDCLVLRLHNSRHNTIFDVRVRAFWQCSREAGRLQPLPLLSADGLPLLDDLCLLHPLEGGSPLRAERLDPAWVDGELVVSFSGVDATLERPIHALHRYRPSEIVRPPDRHSADTPSPPPPCPQP